jgi:trimethylamine--corrinoid protein Co-methyltransferase
VALAGGNYIHHAAGLLESDTVACLEQYILDNDIIGMVLRVLKGLNVDKESLAFEVIERAGPGGNFLTDPHTLQNLRTGEIFIPSTANRNDSNPVEKARTKAKEILDHHRIGVDQRIDEAIRKRFDLMVTREGEWIS